MNGPEEMSFRGQFRSYQKRVLDHADAYLKDGRIHIVAAPGSGKTVLGLELIRRIGRPCIILSPTTAIRGQWGERLRDLFLEDGAQFSAVYSADLHRVRPVTSITYQALYTAIERVPAQGEEDCSDIDILRLLREQGIGTVCLDEAHHLRSEWQRALEKFLGMLGEDCKRIALSLFRQGGCTVSRRTVRMLARAADRDALRKQWTNEVKEGKFAVVAQSEIPREKRVPVFVFRHIAPLLFLLAMEGVLIGLFAQSVIPFSFPVVLAVVCAEGVALYALYRLLRVMVMHFDPARSVRTLGNVVFQTLAECGVLSGAAKVECVQDRECGMVALSLRNASLHDQNIFNTAMAEFLSPIENPRYILIKRDALGGYCYRQSYACPSAIGRKQEFAAVLARKLRADTGRFALVYTRNEGGRAFILKCRRRSYITADRRMIDRKYKVSHWE